MTREAITNLKNGWKDRLKQIEGDLRCLKRQGLNIESAAKQYQYDILIECLREINELCPDEKLNKKQPTWTASGIPN